MGRKLADSLMFLALWSVCKTSISGSNPDGASSFS
jgi:hypothetical protein